MSKFISKSKIVLVAVFIFALIFGFWSGGFFERYVFNLSFVKNFTVAEAENLIGYKVIDTCYKNSNKKERIGTVIGYSTENSVSIRVRVKWENVESGYYTDYPKSNFSKCINIAE